MNHGDATLSAVLPRVEKLDWIGDPHRALEKAIRLLLSVPQLPWALAEHLREEGRRTGSGHRVHELITRTDILLCSSPSGHVDLWLHANRKAITPAAAIRPNITTRGHHQGTIIIAGRLVRSRYRYEGSPHQNTWFNRELLRPLGRDEYAAGSSFVTGPDDIYRWEEISDSAVTLTIDVNYKAQPYRVFTQQLQHIASEVRPPRAQRMAHVADLLYRSEESPQPR